MGKLSFIAVLLYNLRVPLPLIIPLYKSLNLVYFNISENLFTRLKRFKMQCYNDFAPRACIVKPEITPLYIITS